MIKYLTLALGLASTAAMATSTIGATTKIPDVKSESKQGFHGQIGLAAASVPEYIGGKDNETRGLPLINVSYNDRFYFKYNRLGAWIYKNDSFRVGGMITAHAGYDKSDLPSDLRDNLYFDREDSTMAGINAAFKKGMFSAEVAFLTDVSDESEGSKFTAQAGYTFFANAKATGTVIAKVENMDDDMASYYYSAFADGATVGNPVYEAEGTTNFTLGVVGTYRINQKWTAIGAVTATSLGDEIGDSPIVEDDSYNMVLVGATYSF